MKESYWFIVTDNTRKIFSVSGPIIDDSIYDDKISTLQKQYEIICHSIPVKDDTKQNLINYFGKGLKLVELREILS